tara:strand:+ start:54300 stop:55205 length:906 start_codon:yes stop_codon:yes gene_type:complete
MKWIILLNLLIIELSVVYGQKPILPDFHADPSAHYWDGKYWIYPSTDEPGSTSWDDMKRWHCYSSSDLVNWENEGEIFNLDSISWADHAAFAPDAMKWHGKYYFFFPAAFKIGVAIADKPNGPFKDALGRPLINENEVEGVSSFDPTIFIDSDSIPYLYYGGHGGAAMVRLKENLLERDEDIKKIELPGFAEGLWVHKVENTYYFTYPSRIRREGKIKQLLVYCTSKSPYGPFEYHGMFFDNDSRNSHHSIIEIKGKWYLLYHIEGPSPYERKVCVDYLEYNKDGTIKEVRMTKKGIDPID